MLHKNSVRYESLTIWIGIVVSKWISLILFLSIIQADFSILSSCVRNSFHGIHGNPWVKITNLSSGMREHPVHR